MAGLWEGKNINHNLILKFWNQAISNEVKLVDIETVHSHQYDNSSNT